jgi:MFS family permease
VPLTSSYGTLLGAAFLVGMAGSSFSVGAAFVSRWTPAARQGTALGVYGLGTMGQSLAVFVGPVVAARLGWEAVFRGTSVLLLVWAVTYYLLARNPPQPGRPGSFGAMTAILRRAPTAWLLGAFYFLTFRRLRRLLDLPTHAAARAVRTRASGRGPSRGRVRRPRHAHAARGRLAGRPDRRCAGPLVGLRRRGAVLAPPHVAVDGALHGRRPWDARC